MSETWYRTGSFGRLIEPITVERSTEKTLFIRDPLGLGTPRAKAVVDKCAITSTYAQHFRTWDEAHSYLLEKQEKHVKSLRLQLEAANGKLGNIKGLKKP